MTQSIQGGFRNYYPIFRQDSSIQSGVTRFDSQTTGNQTLFSPTTQGSDSFSFYQGNPANYSQDAVNYMKQFEKPDGSFDAQGLSNAYHINMTQDMMQNLDLNHSGKIDLRDATLGLMMESGEDGNPAGAVSPNEQSEFQSQLQQGAWWGPPAIQANQYSLNQIANHFDANGKLTSEVNAADSNLPGSTGGQGTGGGNPFMSLTQDFAKFGQDFTQLGQDMVNNQSGNFFQDFANIMQDFGQMLGDMGSLMLGSSQGVGPIPMQTPVAMPLTYNSTPVSTPVTSLASSQTDPRAADLITSLKMTAANLDPNSNEYKQVQGRIVAVKAASASPQNQATIDQLYQSTASLDPNSAGYKQIINQIAILGGISQN